MFLQNHAPEKGPASMTCECPIVRIKLVKIIRAYTACKHGALLLHAYQDTVKYIKLDYKTLNSENTCLDTFVFD